MWWGTPVEIQHALGRKVRENALTADDLDLARLRLAQVAAATEIIAPSDALREEAMRLAFGGTLRAADALQLAAALECQRESGVSELATFDDRLAETARSHGLTVLARIP